MSATTSPRYRHSAYAVVPARAFADRRLNPGAVMVLGALCVYANQDRLCWPRQETLAEVLGVTRQAVSKQLRLLLETGYVRTRPRGGRGLMYEIVMEGDLPGDCARAEVDVTAPVEEEPSRNSRRQQVQLPVASGPDAQPSVAPAINSGLQQVSTPSCTELSQEQPTEHEARVRAGGVTSCATADLDAAFERLWATYPPYRRRQKGKARDVWRALVRQDSTLVDTIQAAVEAWARTPDWTEGGGRFAPELFRWLRGRRWTDTLPPAVDAARRPPSRESLRHDFCARTGLRWRPAFAGLSTERWVEVGAIYQRAGQRWTPDALAEVERLVAAEAAERRSRP